MDMRGGAGENPSTEQWLPPVDMRASTPEAIALVPKRVAYEAQLLPVRVEDRRLVCLGREPVNPDAVRRFIDAVCREVTIIPAARQDVAAGLRAAYGPPEYVEAIDLVEAVSAKPSRRNLELHESERLRQGPMKVIAVTSGKGGVGKTSITANLAIALASRGYRVGLMDCDFGLSNLHVLLGVNPRFTLSDVINKKVDPLTAFELTQGGVYLLAGPTGASEFANLNYGNLQAANAGFSMISHAFDFLLLDTAAGIHDGVLSLLMAADEAILVATPDPAAILDAYVTARALLDRRPSTVVKCIVNQATNDTQAKLIFAKFMTFLSLNSDAHAEYYGKVAADKAAVMAARMRQPLMLSAPGSQAAKDIEALACKLAGIRRNLRQDAGFFKRLMSLGRPA